MLTRVSTSSLMGAMQGSIRTIQSRLSNAQLELSSGRHADVGLKLGSYVGRNLDWRSQIARIDASMQRNSRFNEQARITQASIDNVKSTVDSLSQTLIGARGAQNGKDLSRVATDNALGSVMDALSVTYAGVFVFSGRNPDIPPLNQYLGQGAQQAYDDAFQATFGFAKTDPQAEFITEQEMTDFINGAFDDLFDDPNWSANWAPVTENNITLRVDANTTADVSANINETPFKEVLKAITLVYETAGSPINQKTFQTVIDRSLSVLATAAQGIGDIQSRIGFGQQAIERSNQRFLTQRGLLEGAVTDTETVSEYDASTRINVLTAQLEASYTVTGRISRLSLLNYI